MEPIYDVIIAGAGPIGLFLACELALFGTSVLILERDPRPSSPWKVAPLGRRGLNTVSIEAFYRRGLLYRLFSPEERPSTLEKTSGFRFGGHFAGLMLNVNKLDLSRWKYRLPGPALTPGPTTIECIETVLTERAESLGVTILRGHGVTRITSQTESGVTVEAGEAGQSFHGKYLVGCDGGQSTIRKAANFSFTGTEATLTAYAIHCTLSNAEKLKPGLQITPTGMYILGPPHSNSLHLVDFDDIAPSFDRRKQEITQEHLQTVLDRVAGREDVKITNVELASSYTDRSKQATSYRKGRILLAGDAAHIHSPLGAQGMNVGIGDAINLGWKLAATVRQESKARSGGKSVDLTLLDTYESERHPIAAWVLEWTRAQVSTLKPDLFGKAIRTLVSDLRDTEDGTNLLIDRVWGLSQRYDLSLGEGEAETHPLVGCSAPDFELDDGSRLGSKLGKGRGLLLDFEEEGEDAAALKELLVGGGGKKDEGRVDYIGGVGAKDRRGIRACLIRPDGVVAWVAEDGLKPDVGAAKTALERWFGF